MENIMKTGQYELPYGTFGGVFGAVADAMGTSRAILPAGSPARADASKPRQSDAGPPAGALARIGQRLMGWHAGRVAPSMAPAQDVFDRLDQWMWRQHTRDVEAYLAGSEDVFEVERRLKALERGASRPLF